MGLPRLDFQKLWSAWGPCDRLGRIWHRKRWEWAAWLEIDNCCDGWTECENGGLCTLQIGSSQSGRRLLKSTDRKLSFQGRKCQRAISSGKMSRLSNECRIPSRGHVPNNISFEIKISMVFWFNRLIIKYAMQCLIVYCRLLINNDVSQQKRLFKICDWQHTLYQINIIHRISTIMIL